MNSQSDKPAENGAFSPPAEPMKIEAVPTSLPPGEVIHAVLGNEETVFIGTVPTGHVVTLCPKGWQKLQRWKLTRMRIARGILYAAGTGRAGGFAAGRFLVDAPASHAVYHRDGNLFDVRLSNLVTIPRGLLRQAKIEAARGPHYKNPDVQWIDADGGFHCHSGKPVMSPTAGERVTKLRHG